MPAWLRAFPLSVDPYEVSWAKGTLTRARSKTRERHGPVVTYKLWPETFALLKRHRAREGDLALTTDEGNPLGSV